MTNYRKVLCCALGALALPAVAYTAPACGDIIRLTAAAPYTLTGNVGPCPGDGLRLTGQGVFNFNGYSVTGVSGSSGASGAGLYLENAYPLTINGAATSVVSNFRTGIRVSPGSKAVIVQGLRFVNNYQAISADQSTDVHIRDNVIEGGDNAEIGIGLYSSGNIKVKNNRISGQSTWGIYVSSSIGLTLINNTVEDNRAGIVAETSTGELAGAFLGNSFSRNFGNGVRISAATPSTSVVTVQGNTANYNTGDGFSVAGGPSSAHRVEDNGAYMNYGAGVNVSYRWSVVENLLTRNGAKDISWDSTPGACFSFNQFGTSAPASLPGC